MTDSEPGIRRLPILPWKRTGRRDLNALATAIEGCEGMLQRGCDEAGRRGRGDRWQEARRALDLARDAMGQGAVDNGWAFVQSARRSEVYWASPEQHRAWVIHLRTEAAEKVGGWRAKTLRELLAAEPSRVSADELHWAMLVRDDRDLNQYRKVAILKDKLVVLAWILGILLVALLVLDVVFGLPLSATSPGVRRLPLAVAVVLFGALGGAVSAIMPLSASKQPGRIPEQLMSWSITVLRPLVGAAAALGVYALLEAGLITVGTGGSPGALLAIAFLAGFSEKLVLGTVQRVIGVDDSNKKEGVAPE